MVYIVAFSSVATVVQYTCKRTTSAMRSELMEDVVFFVRWINNSDIYSVWIVWRNISFPRCSILPFERKSLLFSGHLVEV